ncbi:nucleoside triphosphate pyrophosphohydrolase [Halobacteria archaeon AArc-curdl1]|uniref:Nucleoside triphosphate pyrophosphohydrolase n=1 Tax=Natronosalvus hydrolyticus TaxID=2979988 RepID=A0AAP2Z7E8_9EURY|nr:nucleoside triphosphate pyrophosphohydrolase [Halobacteria archaeon AArc-curdl1]
MPEEYDKLVRDGIPRIIEESGEYPIFHVADGEAYERRLFEKFEEELGEFRDNRSLEELADVLEVVHAFCVHEGWSLESLERRRQEKADERGGFEDSVVLERVVSNGEAIESDDSSARET